MSDKWQNTNRFEVSKGHKLNNVPENRLALWWAEHSIVAVQNLHVCEVGIPHTDDDNGERLVRGSHNGLTSVRHVCHHTISEDEQDVVTLQKNEGKKSFQGDFQLIVTSLSISKSPQISC